MIVSFRSASPFPSSRNDILFLPIKQHLSGPHLPLKYLLHHQPAFRPINNKQLTKGNPVLDHLRFVR